MLKNAAISTNGRIEQLPPPPYLQAWKSGWYAATVKNCCERSSQGKIAQLGLDIETYVPVQKVWRLLRGRRKQKEEVVIHGILFFYAPSREIFATVRNLSYIYSILKYPGHSQPAPIPTYEYERMKLFLEEADEEVTFEPLSQPYQVGAEVYVYRGPMQGHTVKVIREADNKAKIGIDIQLLGSLCTYVNVDDIMPLEEWHRFERPL